MEIVCYLACSMDGFIARPDGGLDWLANLPNPEGSDFGFADFLKRVDGVLMGRKTFQAVESFGVWPYTQPVYVLSNSLKSLDPKFEGKAVLVSGNLPKVLENLKNDHIRRLYVDGGTTVQGALKLGLVDEMTVTTVATLIGKGVRLFGDLEADLEFEIVESRILTSRMVMTLYRQRA